MNKYVKIYNENSDFQTIETLHRNRVKRNRSGEFFVEGVRAITQAVENNWEITSLVYSREKRLSEWAESILQKSNAKKYFEIPLHLMDKLSDKEDASEVIAIVRIPDDHLSRIQLRENPLVVVVDRPSNPGNLGTMIRSCDALGADGLIVSGHATDLYDPETIRATTGSFFCVPSVRVPSHGEIIVWVKELKKKYPTLKVVGTSAKAKFSIQENDFTLPTVILIGNETNGLSDAYQSFADVLITIPMVGYASSLNISNATSIVLYEAARQRRIKSP